MQQDIRWKQRFENFKKAYNKLNEAVVETKKRNLSELEKEGMIQRFEYTFELSWNVMKDFMESENIIIENPYPQPILKEAFAVNLVEDGEVWIDMMETRNKLSHRYNEEFFNAAYNKITTTYINCFKELMSKLEGGL